MSLDTDILIIGGGPSGLGMAIQLIRKFCIRNFTIVEKTDDIGGTWYANTYPGCGCDVPSHFYSFSFALNPDWSQAFAMQPEIRAYFTSLAQQYDLRRHTRLNTTVDRAVWDAHTGTWLVTVSKTDTFNIKEGPITSTTTLRCKILISAVGSLSVPNPCTIPGADSFRGPLFHSARWDHSFDWTDKDIVVIGNGCSATQFVPVLAGDGGSSSATTTATTSTTSSSSDTRGPARCITQFSRQPHWLAPRPNPVYTPTFRALMRWVPGLMRAYRWSLFLALEAGFASFAIENGRAAREKATREQTAYIRANAPTKYADSLVPTTVLGCKRKVMDTGYLACLHKPNVELVQNDPIARIEEDGVVTRAGRTVRADAIVLANGFRTQQPLFPMEIVGEGGESLEAHWDRVNEGGPCAYYGTQVAGFPNFFVLMGPNTVTGHLSVLFSTECQIDYINRVIEPVLTALRPSRVVSARGLLGLGKPPDVVAVREEAERAEVEWMERMTRGLVWATGCSSWGVDEKTGKNTMMYPDWQVKFWLRGVFVRWRDLAYSRSEEALERARRETKVWPRYVTLILLAAAMVGGRKAVGLGYVERFSEVLRELVSDGIRTLMNVAPERLKG